jgi:hypothetical protein
MKTILKISIWLNLGLLGGLIYVAVNQRKVEIAGTLGNSAEITPSAQAVTAPASVAVASELPKPFRWSQLESTSDYRIYVANLRAIGCPEATIQDIVSGDAGRAFSFERNQLGLDGSGTGAWSRLHQAQLVADLLGEQSTAAKLTAPPQSAENQSQPNTETEVAETSTGTQNVEQQHYSSSPAPSYPLVFQKVNMDALGLSASDKAAIQQVQQQFINDIGGPNQNPNDPAYLPKWQQAQINADDALRELLGSQGYMAYEQQLYDTWFQNQIGANASGAPLTINPALFSK